MRVGSPAFDDGGTIPARFAQIGFPGGQNVSPPIAISAVPDGAVALVMTCVDLAPVAKRWLHWAVVGLPGRDLMIAEGASLRDMPQGVTELSSTNGHRGWQGPRPPEGTGLHEYRFSVFAIDESLDLSGARSVDDLLDRVVGTVMAQASFSGTLGQ